MKLLLNILFAFVLAFTGNYAFSQNRHQLHEPAGRGELETVKKVIEKGGNVDKKDIAGQTALMYAAESGSLEVIKYLVEKGADVNAVSGDAGRGTALIYAAAANKLEVVKYLLENGADINATTPYQHETALLWAVAMGHMDAVKLLLEKGADKNIKNRDGEVVLDVARKLNKEDIIPLLESE
ncbi:MAG: ankyrin repeat domain-containing protein [Bacteroidales bacterium]|nr:ankyrin repeat domain-containing protein [Bacteroidales bacterium]MBN2761862.1 ankyrin repeat domain-containing protein [Bacteroidales bacterium]